MNRKTMEVDSTKNEYLVCQSSETSLREANQKLAKEVSGLFFSTILVWPKETFGELTKKTELGRLSNRTKA